MEVSHGVAHTVSRADKIGGCVVAAGAVLGAVGFGYAAREHVAEATGVTFMGRTVMAIGMGAAGGAMMTTCLVAVGMAYFGVWATNEQEKSE